MPDPGQTGGERTVLGHSDVSALAWRNTSGPVFQLARRCPHQGQAGQCRFGRQDARRNLPVLDGEDDQRQGEGGQHRCGIRRRNGDERAWNSRSDQSVQASLLQLSSPCQHSTITEYFAITG
jgi:hypothetical protein